MTDQTTTPEEETNTLYRYWMIGLDGVYDGMITGVSSLGYVVDAANHLPTVLNVLPGEQGFSTFHDRPFLGNQFIYENLTGGMDAYKDTMGIVVPDPVTTSEHFVHGTGEAVGLATTVVAAGPVIGAANSALVGGGEVAMAANAATKVSPVTSIFTAVTESPMAQSGFNALQYIGGKTASLVSRFAIANPLLSTGLLAGADVAYNDGNIVTPIAKSGANYVAEKFGIGTIFTDSSNPDAVVPGPANLYGFANDPAKTAGMLAVMFTANSLLNNYLGNALGLIAGLAIALVFNKVIGETSNDLVDKGRELLSGSPAQRTPAPAPG